MFFSLKYKTSEVLNNNIKIKYFRNDTMIVFISELNQELIEVIFILTKNVFNKSVILLKLQQL